MLNSWKSGPFPGTLTFCCLAWYFPPRPESTMSNKTVEVWGTSIETASFVISLKVALKLQLWCASARTQVLQGVSIFFSAELTRESHPSVYYLVTPFKSASDILQSTCCYCRGHLLHHVFMLCRSQSWNTGRSVSTDWDTDPDETLGTERIEGEVPFDSFPSTRSRTQTVWVRVSVCLWEEFIRICWEKTHPTM